RRRFAAEYGLTAAKAIVVPVGAPDPGMIGNPPSDGILRVLYFGGFIPLHGVPVIVEAARLLASDPRIQFDLVGDGQEAEAIARDLEDRPPSNVRLVRSWMSE